MYNEKSKERTMRHLAKLKEVRFRVKPEEYAEYEAAAQRLGYMSMRQFFIDSIKEKIEKGEIKMKYRTRDREAGNVIDSFETLEEARKAIKDYEETDKKEGTYTPDFYEIYDFENGEIVE